MLYFAEAEKGLSVTIPVVDMWDRLKEYIEKRKLKKKKIRVVCLSTASTGQDSRNPVILEQIVEGIVESISEDGIWLKDTQRYVKRELPGMTKNIVHKYAVTKNPVVFIAKSAIQRIELP